MNQRSSQPSSAFTLLELLITLTLFASLTTLLLGGYFQFQRGQQQLEQSGDLRRQLWMVEKLLSQDITHAIYATKFTVKPQDEDAFQSGIIGKNNSLGGFDLDSIHLHVSAPSKFFRGLGRNQDPSLHEVSWYVEEGEDGQNHLIRREEYYLDDDMTAGTRSQGHSLVQGVTNFDIKYYGSAAKPAEEWESSLVNQLPLGIIVTLEMEDKAGTKVKSQFTKNLPFTILGGK